MITYPKLIVSFLYVLTTFLVLGSSPVTANSKTPKNNVPGQVESRTRHLMKDLKNQGFEVTQGYFKLYTIDDCDYTFDKMGLCYGNNPAAPYVTFAVRPWPEEFVDVTSNLWGPSHPGTSMSIASIRARRS